MSSYLLPALPMIAAGALLLAAPLRAQSGGHDMHGKDSQGKPMQHGAMAGDLAAGDRKFLREAAQGGMAEVELGRMAAEKAASADVKSFGQRMVDDHGQANDRLKALASSKSVALPTDMSREQQQMHAKLAKLSGAAFDREYMKGMLADHKKDVSAFQKESASAKDADVKAFASTTLPTLKEHLKMARDIAAKMGSGGTRTGRR